MSASAPPWDLRDISVEFPGRHALSLPIEGKLIRIDIDPAALTRDYPPDVAIHADGGATLAALAAEGIGRRSKGQVVVVGYHVTYDDIRTASLALRRGADFLAASRDRK